MFKTVEERRKAMTSNQRLAALCAIYARIKALGFKPLDVVDAETAREAMVIVQELIDVQGKTPDSAAAWLVNITTLTDDGRPAIVFNM